MYQMYREAKAVSTIETLHETFLEGSLKVVVGAGVSCASGLPSWDELNLRLLSAFLHQKYGNLDFQHGDLEEAARIFVDHFGREAVVDVVREGLQASSKQKKEKDFTEILHDSLYSERDGPKEESELHLELAAFLGQNDDEPEQEEKEYRERVLYTFNFDNLLERAIERLLGEKAGSRFHGGDRHFQPERPFVHHLHGYLPSTGTPSKHLILSEKDYHATRDGKPVRELKDLFEEAHEKRDETAHRRAVLLVGLSLTDSRLRSVLLDRKEKLDNRAANQHGPPDVYALLYRPPPSEKAPLIERLAYSFVREHEEQFWDKWGIHILTVASSDLLPFILRQIRLGRNVKKWMHHGLQFLREESHRYTEKLLHSSTQEKIRNGLEQACALLHHHFAVDGDEHLGLAGFVPHDSENGFIQLGFRYSSGRIQPEPINELYARDKRLDVSNIDQPFGTIGRAFVWGATTEASRRMSYLLDRSVKRTAIHDGSDEWTNERTFASLLCVPVYDSYRWVPLGVCGLTSNRSEPFWSRLHAHEMTDLERMLQEIFSMALGYRSIWESSRTNGNKVSA